MPRIKLIAIDLDGTLLTSQKRVSQGALEAVREAVGQGVSICLASGRALNTMLPYATELGLDGPFVTCNGAYVLGSTGEILLDRRLPSRSQRTVLEFGRVRGLHTNVYVGRSVFFSMDGKWADLYRRRTGLREEAILGFEELVSLEATKVLFVDHAEAIVRHHAETSKLLDYSEASITLSEPEYIEFLPPGVNKGAGVQAVAMALSLLQHEVAALGDYHNDLEMVDWAGFSGVVANGVGPVREHADLVVASNDEGGAAEFIRAALRFNPGL